MNRAGGYVTVAGLSYKAFQPSKLPPKPEIVVDDEMATLLGEANRELGKLYMLANKIPDINIFLSSYVRKEALMSSQIEGTQTSLVDVLDPDIDSNKNADVEEVVNYTKAMNYAWDRMEEYPLCNSLLKDTHKLLLQGTRGKEKLPGEFRRSQNWIGSFGLSLTDARFVPPTVENMIEAMSDLEKFMNNEEPYDHLIKSALIHYQFETIHPFLDGNGRLGRMLIVLYLKKEKLLKHPVLYISYYLKKHRTEYYDRLDDVRNKGNYEQWVRFFLKGVIATCKDSIQTIEDLSSLRAKNIAKLPQTKNAKLLFEYIEKNPIVDIKKTADELKVAYNTIATAISNFVKLGIMKEITSAKRNRVFFYHEYIEILKRDTENL
ncbi:MAG: Fic family protein [Firmicutes bacterium]|nr:Fic family protein [Bacillota bacterium]